MYQLFTRSIYSKCNIVKSIVVGGCKVNINNQGQIAKLPLIIVAGTGTIFTEKHSAG